MQELMNCPFCGSDDLKRSNNKPGFWHHWVQCKTCEGSMDTDGSTEKAVAKWNTRASTPSALPVEGAGKVYLVCTGEVYEGQETYTRHEGAPPPLSDAECLYASPAIVGTPSKDGAAQVQAVPVASIHRDTLAMLQSDPTVRDAHVRGARTAEWDTAYLPLYTSPPASPAEGGGEISEQQIDLIANEHCPGGIAYPSNVKNAIRAVLSLSPSRGEPAYGSASGPVPLTPEQRTQAARDMAADMNGANDD